MKWSLNMATHTHTRTHTNQCNKPFTAAFHLISRSWPWSQYVIIVANLCVTPNQDTEIFWHQSVKSVRPHIMSELPVFGPAYVQKQTRKHIRKHNARIFLCVERSERGCEHTDVPCAWWNQHARSSAVRKWDKRMFLSIFGCRTESDGGYLSLYKSRMLLRI